MANIDLPLIQELRARTGVGMMDCKKALIEASGDMEKAVELLRKKGASVAAKRAGNVTSEGLVHAYIHAGSQIGVLIEINCETDFVARTNDVKEFAHDVAMHIAAMKPQSIDATDLSADFIAKERIFFKEQLIAEGKPAGIVDKIVEGKVEKLYSEVCLMNQKFIKNDKKSINDLLQELIAKMGEKIKINKFIRYEVGT